MHHRKASLCLSVALLVSAAVIAQTQESPEPQKADQGVAIRPDAPSRYIVKKGDTLWDLSNQFLVDPWRWPEIWEANPQVHNPHLIYPGDELALFYRGGKPVIRVIRGEEVVEPGAPPVISRQTGPREFKLTPQARAVPREEAISTIPVDAIQQFLARPRVLDPGQFESAPYVVSVGSEALIGHAGKEVFARALGEDAGSNFGVYRQGQVYRNPEDSSDILGYEVIHVADVVLEAGGDPATLLLTQTNREVLIGDRLLPVLDDQLVTNFIPRPPNRDVQAQIIAVMDGVTQIGENQIVVLNLGTREGIEQGHVLTVWQRGETIPDAVLSASRPDQRWRQSVLVTMPDKRAGVVMVFRPFERVSYALVMQASRAMHVQDMVKTP